MRRALTTLCTSLHNFIISIKLYLTVVYYPDPTLQRGKGSVYKKVMSCHVMIIVERCYPVHVCLVMVWAHLHCHMITTDESDWQESLVCIEWFLWVADTAVLIAVSPTKITQCTPDLLLRWRVGSQYETSVWPTTLGVHTCVHIIPRPHPPQEGGGDHHVWDHSCDCSMPRVTFDI